MKLYPVKNCPHFDYLHSKYREKQRIQNTRIVKSTIAVNCKYINSVVIVDKNKIYFLQVEIGTNNAKEYQFLIELERVFDIIIIDEIIVVACRNGYVGWSKIERLLSKQKFGKIRLTKEFLNSWSFSEEADKSQKSVYFQHFQITKIGSQMIALYSNKEQIGINLMNVNNKSMATFIISLKSLGIDSSLDIANFILSPTKSDCIISNKEFVICLLLRKNGQEVVQQFVNLVVIKLLDDSKVSVLSETIFQYHSTLQQFELDCGLRLCPINTTELVIYYRNQLMIIEKMKESWKIAAIVNSNKKVIEMIAFHNTLTNQNILLTIFREQNYNYALNEYHIDRLIKLQEISPTKIALKQHSSQFISFITLKTTEGFLIILHFTNSTYYFQNYLFSLSSILNNMKESDYSEQIKEQVHPFQEQFFQITQPAIDIDFCKLLPLTQIKNIINNNRQSFIETLNQLLVPQLILQRVNHLDSEVSSSRSYNLWVSLVEFIREYMTIFLYLVKLIQQIRSSQLSDQILFPNKIKDLLRQVNCKQIDILMENHISIDHQQYEQLIIQQLKQMKNNIKIMSFILTENCEGQNSSPFQISTNYLMYRNIILELGFFQLISYFLNPQQFSEYLIYKIYLSYNQKDHSSFKMYQSLLAKIVHEFKDYPPLACLMAGQTQLFYLNKIHLERCLQEIQAQTQDNLNQFAHLKLVNSVNLKLERYLTNHNLQNLVIFSQSQSMAEKYSSLSIAIRIRNQSSQNTIIKGLFNKTSQINNYLTLDEFQILKILNQMTTQKLNIGLSIATDNKYFKFGQQIQLLNNKLLILLKSHYVEMTKIRTYNLSILYDFQVISNQKYILTSVLPRKNRITMIPEWKYNKFGQILSNYLSELLVICLQYHLTHFTQFLTGVLEEFSEVYCFQKYLKKQELLDQSEIVKTQQQQNFLEKQFFEANKEEKLYTSRLSQILDQLYEDLRLINTSQFQIEEQMENQVFLHQFIKIKRYLMNKSAIKSNRVSVIRQITNKKPNSLSTLASAQKSIWTIDKAKVNRQQSLLQSPIHVKYSSSQIGDYLLNIACNRNKYQITHSGKQLIETELLQNVLELSLQYHCSIFSYSLDILQQLLGKMHLIKQKQKSEIEKYGLQAIVHLFQFNDI